LKFESRTHEAQLEDQKAKKSSRRSFRRRKSCKTNKRHEKWQTKEKSKEKLKFEKKLKTAPEINSPQHSQFKLSPLDRHYHVSALNHPVRKESNKLCAHTLLI
jgi:hypothetical protein